jgi:endonuclease/exonuclease/phosphatase family metal-dependent hydrolase
MRAATFNIKHGRQLQGGIDIGLLARTCVALRTDVLALQEVDVRQIRSRFANQAARVAAASNMKFVFGPAYKRFGGSYGNALLVRGEIEQQAVLHLPQRSREPRSCVLASVRAAGLTLSVAAGHLSTHRHEAVDQLEVIVERLRAMPGPHLLLGDLNLEPERVEPVIAPAGLTLVPHGPTFPNEAPRLTIDHIACDGLRLQGADTPMTPCSDHRPLVADLEPAVAIDLGAEENSYTEPASR